MQIIDRGSGPPLILIPGIQGRWESMQPAIESLAQWFRVITFPLGDEPSSSFAFEDARGFDNYVVQVRAALDESRVDRAVVCGVSFGGLVALRFAAEHPDRTAQLILVSTPGPTWHLRPRHEVYTRLPYLFGPLFAAETPWRLRHELSAAFPTFSARRAFAASQLATLVRAPLSFARIARRARMIGKTAAAGDCARIAAPTLVVTGEPNLDHIVPPDVSTSYTSLIPGARRTVLERTGHLGFITRSIEFAAAVREFVDRGTPHRPGMDAQRARSDRSTTTFGSTGPSLPVIHVA